MIFDPVDLDGVPLEAVKNLVIGLADLVRGGAGPLEPVWCQVGVAIAAAVRQLDTFNAVDEDPQVCGAQMRYLASVHQLAGTLIERGA